MRKEMMRETLLVKENQRTYADMVKAQHNAKKPQFVDNFNETKQVLNLLPPEMIQNFTFDNNDPLRIRFIRNNDRILIEYNIFTSRWIIQLEDCPYYKQEVSHTTIRCNIIQISTTCSSSSPTTRGTLLQDIFMEFIDDLSLLKCKGLKSRLSNCTSWLRTYYAQEIIILDTPSSNPYTIIGIYDKHTFTISCNPSTLEWIIAYPKEGFNTEYITHEELMRKGISFFLINLYRYYNDWRLM